MILTIALVLLLISQAITIATEGEQDLREFHLQI